MQDNNFNINDDDFIIGKGFNVEEPQAEEKRKHGKRAKKGGNSTIKNIIWIICIIVVSVGLAITLIFAGADYLGIGFGRGEDERAVKLLLIGFKVDEQFKHFIHNLGRSGFRSVNLIDADNNGKLKL